jgi:hypothetical protein
VVASRAAAARFRMLMFFVLRGMIVVRTAGKTRWRLTTKVSVVMPDV